MDLKNHLELSEDGYREDKINEKKTDFLIIGSKAGSKVSKAKKLGINILDENQFLNKINQ